MKNKRSQKILSAILALVFILGITTPGEILASGNYQAESDPKLEIVAFEELAAEIAAQEVPLGTKKSELNLPAILIATVKLAMEDEAAVTDAVYASDDAEFDSIIYEKDVQEKDSSEPGTMEIPVPVSWKSIPEYDGDTAGVYTFRAEISGFTLSAVPPVITVTVYEEKLQGTISSFEEFEEDLRWQNTKNPILPEKVKGIVEDKVIDIPVTWEADRDYDQNFPESGLYVFTAKLGEGYVPLPGVEAPRITVYIPPARKMALMMAGNATETDPLIITTAAQLSEIATLVNMGKLETFIFNNKEAKVHLKLGIDIDLSSYGKNYRSGKGWMPIGTIDNPFKGQFNGDGKTIAGLYIDDRSLEYAGLFGAVSEGKIENLGLEDLYINGGDYAGGLAGYINNSTIESCYVTGAANGDTAGGITGKVCGNSVIRNCYSGVSVSGSSNAGGVAGLIESGSVESCYAMGKVEGSIAGGVAGKIENGKVENCAALNFNIAASSVVARVVGDNQGTLSNNAAFSYMIVTVNNNPKSPTDEANGIDGQNIDANGIKADKTIGGRFAPEGGWTTETGKLPGLFGKAVDMPEYIEDKTDPYFIGQGTENEPFLIATAEQLVKLAELVNKGDTTYNSAYYRLMADIDLSVYDNSNTSFNGGRGWVPIGKSGRSFSGTFDGDGHTITGLYIDDAGMSGAGLLGYVSGGTIKNIGLKNVNIKANYDVGAVSGYIENGAVENCYVTGVVECRNVIGGVVSYARNSTIKNCYATAEVISTVEANPGYYSNAGGVVGIAANSTVQGCYSAGTVNCKSNYVGGIVGEARENTSVISCAALNYSVSGSSNVGRVIGYLYSTNLVGNVGYEWILNGSGGKLSDENNPSGQHGKKISADELQYCINLPADFQSSPWTCADSVLPGLFGETVEMPTHITDRLDNQDPYFVGKGTKDEPFLIATAQQLKKLADMVSAGDTKYNSAQYKLASDIDLSDYSTGDGWTPIGTEGNPFKGTFDGNNKWITGLRINRDAHRLGLFGYIDGGTVRNIGVIDVHIYGSDNIGAVAGYVDNNCTVENCYSSGSVSANYLASGLVGQINNSSIVQNCYSTANVKSNYNVAGGIAGWATYYSIVRNCYSSGDVRGNNVVGGVVGVLRNNSRVEYCYSTGSVSGNGEAGGVVGKIAYSGAVKNCAALNSFVSGKSNVGRVVGVYDTVNLSGNIAFSGLKVLLNGSDKTMDEGHDKVDGKSATTSEIKTVGFFETLFENNAAWEFGEGRLPVLKGLEGQDSAIPFHIDGLEGTGDSNDPYLIKTAADLARLAELVNTGTSPYADGNKCYKLENDIDLSGYGKTYREGKGWVPIGTSSRPFKGHFDGNGKEIRGLYINDSSLSYAGLFGYIAGGSIRDLGLIKVNITGQSYVGALAGFTTDTVEDCYATGSVNGNNDYVGGLIGYLDSNGEVAKCYVYSYCKRQCVGGGPCGLCKIWFGRKLLYRRRCQRKSKDRWHCRCS